MARVPLLHEPTMRLVRAVSPLLARGSSKLARGIRGRRGAAVRLGRWGREERDPSLPTVWVHAPSVGEGLQAQAVVEALAVRRRDLQVVYTHFSPSAEGFRRRMIADTADYLPWDVREETEAVLDAIEPDLLLFTKTEVWPGLVSAAEDRGIPSILMAATLPLDARRTGALARRYLRGSFAALERVLAISAPDGDRFALLGVPGDRIVVTGDPAVDSAWRRARDANPSAPHLAPFRVGRDRTLVAGSTWGPDEEVLLPAIGFLRRVARDLRVIIAPHEPTPEHVGRLRGALEDDGWRVRTLGEVESGPGGGESAWGERESGPGEAGSAPGAPGGPGDPRRLDGVEEGDAVVVDRVGVLADLYTVGAVALVGGGFHRHGLHSVLEPAAAGVPVLFGPRHTGSRAASELLDAGAARVVEDAETLREVLEEWLVRPGVREKAAERASMYVRAHRGAADRTAEVVDEVLSRVRGRSPGGPPPPRGAGSPRARGSGGGQSPRER